MTDVDSPLALVLSGGGARGAYEVGVLRYVLGKLIPRLGDSARPRIFSGTSVGAINACAVAAHHDLPDFAVGQLAERWRQLSLERIFRLGWSDLGGLMRWILGSARDGGPRSLLDAAPLAELVRSVIPWRNLHQGVSDRRVLGVTVSATDVETGHTVVFIETEDESHRLGSSGDRAIDWTVVRLTPQHALASAAIPIIFPTVRIVGRAHPRQTLGSRPALGPGGLPAAAARGSSRARGSVRHAQLPAVRRRVCERALAAGRARRGGAEGRAGAVSRQSGRGAGARGGLVVRDLPLPPSAVAPERCRRGPDPRPPAPRAPRAPSCAARGARPSPCAFRDAPAPSVSCSISAARVLQITKKPGLCEGRAVPTVRSPLYATGRTFAA